MALNFNTNPYYDDFDEDKNFHRILFRPGRAVQARELTQSQTILQNQIDRFGKHVFEEGSKVTGGEAFDENVLSVKLQATFSGNTINISGYDGYYALANSTNVVYQIKKTAVADGTDPNTLFLTFIKSAGVISANANSTVSNSETLKIYSSGDLSPANLVGNVITSSTETSFTAKLFHVAEGVFFTNGCFVKSLPQTVPLSKYTNNANVTVGFDISESIIESSADSSLLDPAAGASNYIAPGADRYKIALTLSAKDIVDNSIPDLTSSKYIEIARYREGVLVKNTRIPFYSELEETLARRTFDESGNYRVEGLDPKIPQSKFSVSANTTFTLDITNGKAYVKGFEIDKASLSTLVINKARSSETVSGYDVPAYYGNYILVSSANGSVINFSTAEKLEIHSNNGNFGASTKIAEAYPKNLEYVSGNGSASVYKLHLFNIVKTSSLPLDLANTIIAGNSSSVNATCNVHSSSLITRSIAGTFNSANPLINLTSSSGVTIGMRVDGTGIPFPTYVTAVNGNQITINQNPAVSNTLQTLTFRSAYLTDTNFEDSVFEASYDVVKQFSQVNYNAKRVFKSVSFVAGVASVQTNDGTERFKDVSGANLQKHYAICIRTGGTGSFPNFTWVDLSGGTYISVPAPSSGSPATLNINLGDGTFNGTADILTTLDITAAARRTKTLSQNNIKRFVTLDSANTFSLGYADVINVSAIYIATGTNTASNANVNVVGSFDIDYGQRGSFYDHATIKLKNGQTVNTGNTMVVFDHYTHSGTGFFDTLSYPTYNTIPSYTKTNGVTIDLRDSIDFRPIRTANTTSNVYSNLSMSFVSQQIVDSLIGSVDTNLEYYLPRNDKVVLRKNGTFAVLEGVSALNNPPVPNDEPDAMTICTLSIQPYTYNPSNVSLKIESNRRYTMKDIGALDTRLRRVEYYTALNLLEKDVATTTYYDDQDNQLFNNGFIVDPFRGHSIGDVYSSDYSCSIDYDNQVLRPRFEANGTSLSITSNTLAITDNVLTLSYTSVPYITQNIASEIINVNPFDVVGFIGYVKLAKDTSAWVDFASRPDVIQNISGDMDNYASGSNFEGTQWNNWSALGYADESNITYTYYSVTGQVIKTTTNAGVRQQDSAIIENKILEHVSTGTLNIDFELYGIRPNTELAVYFDSTQLSSYLRVYEANASGNIVSVTANTDAVGPAATACTYTLLLSGGGTDNTAAVVRVTTAATGRISNIVIVNPGLYTGTPTANTFGNTVFTIAVNANTPGYTANGLVTDSTGYVKGRLEVPKEVSANLFTDFVPPEDVKNYKLTVGKNHLYFCDNRTSMRTVSTLAETFFFSANPPKKKPKNAIRNSGEQPPSATLTSDRWKTTMVAIAIGTQAGIHAGQGPGQSDAWRSAVSDATGGVGFSPYSNYNDAVSAAQSAASLVDSLYDSLGRDADPEGYSYWVTVASSEGVDPGWVTEAFNNAAQAKGECPNTDPLAQTFFVNEFTNPDGIFVESIDLYFASRDETGIPVSIQLRPTVNGYPDSKNFVAGSQVTLNTEDINIPTNPNVPVPTRFKFSSPIYLEPGEHSFVVLANSDKYTVYIGTINQARLDGVGPIVSQPYIGSLFKSQNASTWTPEQNSDICFIINQCKFDTNTSQFAVLNPIALGYNQLYEVSRINLPYETIAQSANITFDLATKNNGGSLGNYIPVIPNSNIILDQRKVLNAATDANIRVVMSTTNSDVSPVLDVSRSSYTVVKNLLDSPAAANVVSYPETLASGGGALSKYIMRKVTLAEDFDATALRVYLQQNLPQGSSIQVYYRVQAANDSDRIENKPWTLMTQTNVSSTNQNFLEYYDYEYKFNDVSYISGGVTYKNFRTFSIKIVFYSTNPANAPTAKNLRVIALS